MTEIVADQMQMLGSKGDDGGYRGRQGDDFDQRPEPQSQEPKVSEPPFNPDDDIPF